MSIIKNVKNGLVKVVKMAVTVGAPVAVAELARWGAKKAIDKIDTQIEAKNEAKMLETVEVEKTEVDVIDVETTDVATEEVTETNEESVETEVEAE